MTTSGITSTVTNGVHILTVTNAATSSVPISATSESIVITTGGKLGTVNDAAANCILTDCNIHINQIGSTGGSTDQAALSYSTNTNTRTSLGNLALRNTQVVLDTGAVRRDLFIRELTNSKIICKNNAVLGSVYTPPGAIINNSLIQGVGWWEPVDAPATLFNLTCKGLLLGVLIWDPARLDLYGFSAPNFTSACAGFNSNHAGYFWNPGIFDTTKLWFNGSTRWCYIGITASFEIENASGTKQQDALVIYRETYDGGALTEVARFTTNASGRMTGTYDTRTRTTGADQQRPTLYLRTQDTIAGSTYPGINNSLGNGGSWSLANRIPYVEIRAYGLLPLTGYGPSDVWPETTQFGTLSFDTSVSVYASITGQTDTRLTANYATASAISGITHTPTSMTVTTGTTVTLDQLYDSRAAYWRATDGITYASGSGFVFGSNCALTVEAGATLSVGTKLRSFSTTGAITMNGDTTVDSYTGSGGTFVRLTMSGQLSGSSVHAERVTGAVELLKVIGSGTSESAYVSYTTDEPVAWRVRKQGYEPLSGTATLTAAGLTITTAQVSDPLQTAGADPADATCDTVNKKIRATGTRAAFTCQELVDIVRRCECTSDGIELPIYANVSGKVDLGGGVLTALTVEMIDPWQVSWAAGSVAQATISGGNLVGGIAGDPIEDVAGGPQITNQISASATIVDLASPAEIAAAVRAELATELARINVANSTLATQASVTALGSPLQTSAYVSPDNAVISAINARLPADPADQSAVEAAIAAIPAVDLTGIATAANVIDSQAVILSAVPTALANAAAVRNNLATELARIDVAMSTRSSYNGTDTPGTSTLLTRVAGIIPTNPLLSNDTRLNNLDATISSRSTLTAGDIPAGLTAAQVWTYGNRELTSAAGLTPSQAATLDQIALDVTVLPNDPASQGTILAAIAAIPAAPSATTTASAVRSELATELARVDVAVSSRSNLTAAQVWAYATRELTVASGLTPAQEAVLADVKAQTDQLVFVSGDVRATLAGEVVDIAAGSLVPLAVEGLSAVISDDDFNVIIDDDLLTATIDEG